VAAHSEDFMILACTVLIQLTSVTDRRTDRRSDDGKDARSILLLRVKMKVVYTFIWESHHGALERYLLYGITHCYLPPDTGERALP